MNYGCAGAIIGGIGVIAMILIVAMAIYLETVSLGDIVIFVLSIGFIIVGCRYFVLNSGNGYSLEVESE